MSECDSIMFEICDLLCSKDDVFTAVHDFEYIASKIKEAALSKKFVLVELVNGDPQETRNEIEKNINFIQLGEEHVVLAEQLLYMFLKRNVLNAF